MIQLRQLTALAVLAGATAAMPAAAESQVTSVSDVFQQQSLQELISEQQEREVRRLLRPRATLAPETEAAPAGRTLLAGRTLPVSRASDIERLDALHRRHTHISRTLLAVGAGALAAGFTQYVRSDGLGMTWAQGALLGGGFGVTVVGSQSWNVAADAHARAEELRRVRFANGASGR